MEIHIQGPNMWTEINCIDFLQLLKHMEQYFLQNFTGKTQIFSLFPNSHWVGFGKQCHPAPLSTDWFRPEIEKEGKQRLRYY